MPLTLANFKNIDKWIIKNQNILYKGAKFYRKSSTKFLYYYLFQFFCL